ncbi:protein of unknown function [Rhodovastum atsumiense]|nr:protein of unknown function [Rhodovastum atsumiense]
MKLPDFCKITQELDLHQSMQMRFGIYV